MAHASDTGCRKGSKSGKLVVAAIDFGTTYSGYAFSFANDYKEDPLKVHVPSKWVAGTGALMSLKTPTVLLLNPDKTFNSFGYEAENEYVQLAEDGEHQNYHYFRRFKMMLYNSRGLKRDMEIKDSNGVGINALTVFAVSIKYLKTHMMDNLHNTIKGMSDDDVHWILTVPAIWNDGSKQFMREAAQAAGIKCKNLDIALEPEAASLFCMHLPVDKMDMQGNATGTPRGSPFAKGTKYMVVDVGGGTVDITLHEVVETGKLKELDHANGGEWGGTQVDASFENFLTSIFGNHVFDKFKREFPDDYIDLYREFETKKRTIKSEKTGRETIKIPVKLIETYENNQRSFQDRLSEIEELKGKVTSKGDKMRVDIDIVKSWFDVSCKNSVEHLAKLFKSEKSKGVDTILLVGGFSDCKLLQDALKSNFSSKRIIIPEDAGLVVLKGAVLYGHDPLTIVSRVAKCSYGIRVYRDFDPKQHPENKKVKVGKRTKCKDVFAQHVTKGQELVIDEAQSEERYTPLEADQVSLVFDVYTSSEKKPLYVTDVDCTYVGQLEVEVPDISDGKQRGVIVSMIFGGTEIRVEGKVEKTGKVTKASFDFLQ